MKKRACILVNEMAGTEMEEFWMAYDPTPYLPSEYEVDILSLRLGSAVRDLLKYHSRYTPDVYINMADGKLEEDRAGTEIIWLLEKMGVPFTGNGLAFYTIDREDVQLVTNTVDAQFPKNRTLLSYAELEKVAAHLAADQFVYPVIVKHWDAHNSLGLTPDSVCHTLKDVEVQAARMLALYGGTRIEEFIYGQECTVLVQKNPDDEQEPFVYPPIAYVFEEGEAGFKHFAHKWAKEKVHEIVPLAEPLHTKVREIARDLFVALEGDGYARMDMRIRDGVVYVLDVNAPPSVFNKKGEESSADEILGLEDSTAGRSLFMERLLQEAYSRARIDKAVGMTKTNRMGLVAKRQYKKGEVVIRFEGKMRRIASRSEIETWKHWYASEMKMYNVPIGRDLYMYWSTRPKDWIPFNHSCNPNCGYTGKSYNISALKKIEPGEEITVDYRSYADDFSSGFLCNCGSDNCTGTIEFSGYQERWRQSQNITPYLASFARAEQKSGAGE
jgi:D-alanine-D-alanine ligase-like ATP-grasp enzyme